MTEKPEETKQVEMKDRYVLKEVVTQKGIEIGTIDSEEVFTEKGLLIEILNKLDRIEKALA